MNIANIEVAIAVMIQTPTRSSVNTNTTYVIFNLKNAGFKEESAAYRDWVCMSRHKVPNGWENIVKLQERLEALDRKTPTLPASATYGT